MPYNINSGYGKITAQAVPMGASKIFYICKAGTSTYNYLSQIFPCDSDGVPRVYAADGTADEVEFNAAVTNCVGGRNDYILVYPGTYVLAEPIALTGKSSVHLIAVNGLTMDVGTPGATILRQDGSYTTITMNAFCELAGFQIENKVGYSAIDVPTGIGWSNIHNNLFKWWGSAGIDCVWYGSGASWGSIHHNKFVQWAGTAARSCIYIGNAATTAVTVANNDIVAFGSVVWDYGIVHTGMGGLVRDNYISESGGSGATGGGTITIGIEAGVATGVANNRICVASGQGVNGGTANVSFSDNRDGQAGGAAAITT